MSLDNDIKSVMRNLIRVTDDLTDECQDIVYDIAKMLRDEIVIRVPVDEGTLEDSVGYRVWKTKNGATAAVFIGDEEGKAVWLHDSTYKLGERSQLKQDASGIEVGPGYMERAWEDNESYYEGYVLSQLRKQL
jgi:hypothetical protein